ncbi:amino acid adenylation domain-containing protein [Micromonospora terminaliae]|uniref:Amino acid adenylation domain-containing protein n=1 Tax=Micromonospora terminaliae TaxID=1914461 RepID=A0AAJ2ZHY8_9ACTN|nr:amino acid adenylation domain-containing protein [Micromonospora terminaliae]NES30217.1 amino acid adenylation domain-containing protein [Micromonospora terminaliae]QGL47014.1 amino acid adenylation domain-containing protein [Micromonospora terminaliae]
MIHDISSSTWRPSASQVAWYLAEQTTLWAGGLQHCQAVLVAGDVVPAALATACADLQRRHAMLRRHFRDVDGEPLLVPSDGSPVELVAGVTQPLDATLTVAAADANRRFDLSRRPAIRVGVYPVEGGSTLVALTIHAAVGGRSVAARLLDELGDRYRSAVADPPRASDGTPPIEPDGAERTTDAAPAPDGVSGALPAAPQAVAWPTNRGRGRSHGRSITRPWSLDESQTTLVRRFADQTGVSLASVLRCALRVLLLRETGEPDVLIGAPKPTRAGEFQVVPEEIRILRHPLDEHTSVVDTLRAEHVSATQPVDHPGALNALLSRALRPERGAEVDVQVGFRCDTAAEPPAAWAGMVTREVDLPVAHSPYELEFDVAIGRDRVVGAWRGAVGLFDEETLDRMGRSYSTLLHGLVHGPAGPIGELDVIHPTDRARLAEWEAPTSGVSGEDTLVELVHRWIRDTPDRPAVVMADVVHTYRDLDDAASRIAAGLRALQLPAESPIGILVARRVELPAILLGVARAGLAAVPMDPDHPAERLSYIVSDSGCGGVIIDGTLRADRATALGVPLVPLSDLLAAVPAAGGQPPHPDSLAYVLYTSGSTGRPKGVAVTHRGLANCLVATRQLLDFRPDQSLLAVTTISFDIAMLETFLALTSGGRTILATSAQARNGAELQAVLARHRPDVMQATPMTWRILFATGWPGDPQLTVSCGGDVVSPELASRLVACTKEFWHTYGPTEASMYGVCERLPRQPQPPIVPVGRPLPGVWLRILDAAGRPVPPGVVGELHIGGVGVARGYICAPGQTAERFVPDPSGDGGRLYRTGDLARWRADGRLELRGRNDRQVKIRGHRIEPDEIESVLSGHPDVAFAATVVAGQDRDSRGIVAFLQPRQPGLGQDLVSRVAAHARQALPAYMVPSSYALMSAMPLTATGKIDRAALARIRPPRPNGAESDPEARWMTEAWRAVAGDDDRAELPGDLRLAWKLRALVRRELGVQLRLDDIVAASTAADQAQRIRQARLAAGAPPLRWSGRPDRSALVLLQGDAAWPAQAVAEFERWFRVAILDISDGRPQDVPARLATIDAPGAAVLAACGELVTTAAELSHTMRERIGVGPKVLAVEPPAPSGSHPPEHAPQWVVSHDRGLLRTWRATAEDADLVLLALGHDAATDWSLLASVVAGMR